MRYRICYLIFFLSVLVTGKADPPVNSSAGFGPELIYNLPLEEIGFGVRGHIPLRYHWFVSPQLNYFPPFAQLHELNFNLHASFLINPQNRFGFYITGGPYFNYWINYANSVKKKATVFNYGAELGIGILKNYGCLRPFAEWKYNAKWDESNVRIGFIYFPRVCRRVYKCATYY